VARQFVSSSLQQWRGFNPIAAVPLTFAAWAKTSTTSGTQTVAAATHWDGSGNFVILDLNGGAVRCAHRGSDVTTSVSTGAYSTTDWFHAACMVSSASARAVFLNGVKTTDANSVGTLVNINLFSIGELLQGGSGQAYMNGSIAEVGVWNAALDDAEINALAQGFSAFLVRPQSLMAYYPLFGNVAGGERDAWKSKFDLFAINEPAKASHPRIIVPGG
jgi:concanavalin A-like lectin/glucanase superfamily protein